MYLFSPLILQNFKKILRANPKLWGCAIFRSKMTYLSWTILGTNIIIIYLLAFSIVQNFKKFLQRIKSYEDVPFLGPHLPQTNIFWKIINIVVLYLLALFRRPVNEPCFVHSCLSTCQNSKLDIDLRVNYWWLKNTEISLAESHFWL